MNTKTVLTEDLWAALDALDAVSGATQINLTVFFVHQSI